MHILKYSYTFEYIRTDKHAYIFGYILKEYKRKRKHQTDTHQGCVRKEHWSRTMPEHQQLQVYEHKCQTK